MKLMTIEANQSMMDAMKGCASTMSKVNADMDISSIQQLMKEFQKESMKMEMNGEMMNDAIDGGMDTVDD